jgi:hypothetical protein
MRASVPFRWAGSPVAGHFVDAHRWGRARRGVFLAGVLAIILSGCLSVPVAETDAMATATDAVASTSDILIGQLNTAEKQILLQKAKLKTDAYTFVLEDAALYATLDTFAPETAQFKAAIDILKNYAGLIKSLVEGQNASAEGDQIKTIIDNVSAIPGVGPEFKAAVGAFLPLVDKALLAGSRAEARDLVARGRPAVTALIGALKAGTPAMFRELVAGSFAARASFDSEKARVQFSNYVILLDRLQATFDRLADAFANPTSPTTLATLAQATGELVADAKLVQQGLAALK